MRTSFSWKNFFGVLAFLGLGTFLRFYHNTDISLWHDEAFSALLIKYSWAEMFYRIGLDVHPPMYYIALRVWSYGFGDSLLALRSFSIFFGSMTAIAAYLFTSTAFKSTKAAFFALILVLVSPFQIQYATEARMYTFGAFFSVIAAYFLVKALETQKDFLAMKDAKSFDTKLFPTPPGKLPGRTFLIWYLLFAISVGVIILTHYYLLFTAAALCFYGLLYHAYHYRFRILAYFWLFLSYGLIALSFYPWYKIFLFQYKQVGSGYWIPAMDKWSIPGTLWQMFIGIGIDVSKPTTQIVISVVTVFSLIFLFWFVYKSKTIASWLVMLALAAPFAGSILFLIMARIKGENSSVYLVRYFLYASTFYLIAIGVWLSNFKIKSLSYLLFLLYIAANLGAFYHYWLDLKIESKPGMNEASRFLTANVAPNHKLYVGSSFEFFNLKYYNKTQTRPLLFSGGQTSIASMPHYAGTAILTDQDLLPDFNTGVEKGDIVWLVWTNGFGGSKPETPTNWEKLDEKGFAEVRPYVGTWVIITEYKVN